MGEIEINGRRLHEVGMWQRPHTPGVVVSLRYPQNRIQFSFKKEENFFEVPPLLAVELYRAGILPQNSDVTITIKVGEEKAGDFLVDKVVYPSSCLDVNVRFELKRT